MTNPSKILVATHHKTGTAWIGGIFQKIAKELALVFIKEKPANGDEKWDILHNNHSRFNFEYFKKLDYRGFHIIRDPRDIAISGAFYHCKSSEEWLHVKKPAFGGLTYQEKINSYDDFSDKLLFEMEHTALNTIAEIKAWDYTNPNFINVKYEDLIVDNQLFLFHKIYDFLQFSGHNIPKCLQISYDNSLFSGNLKKDTHRRSGKSQQWKKYFKTVHHQKFLELYGNVLVELDYESKNSSEWSTLSIKKEHLV